MGETRRPLVDLLRVLAAEQPTRVACELPSRPSSSLTYEELEARSRRVAAGLARLGLSRGDRLGVWLPTLPEWFVLLFAAARLGVVVVAVNPRYRVKELVDVLGTSGAAGVVVPTQFLGVDHPALLAQAVPLLPALRHVVLLDPTGAPADVPLGSPLPHPVAFDDLLVDEGVADGAGGGAAQDLLAVFTTSGTTSSPKLAAHTQGAVAQHMLNVARAFDLHPGDAAAIALPLAGVFGFSTALGALAGGAACVLQPVFDARELAGWITDGRITHVNGADNMLSAVLDALPAAGSPSRWRNGAFASFSGGGVALVRQAEQRAGVRLSGLYGASEVFALAARWSPDLPELDRARAGGVPISPEIEVRAADPESGQVLGPGAPGELQFRGYNVCREYYANPTATAAARTPDGWFRSGDLGTTLADGGFVFSSRLKDTLRLRGFLTDPAEIEEFLGTHESVRLAQVVGVPRTGEGDVAVAFVQLEPGKRVAPEALLAHCRGRLANYKVPSLISIVDAFPTVSGPNGEKVQKNRLREQAALLFG